MLNNTILIVDDNEGDLDILVELLGKDYNVRVAMDGKSALQAIDLKVPALILLDVMMPGMDGYEVCNELKLSPRTSSIPVIFISALNATSDKVQGGEAGGVDYIFKPIQAEEIQTSISNLALPHAKSEVNDYVSVSMGGCSMLPTTKNNAEQLLKVADIALYQAKELGRNRYVVRPFSLEND